MSEFKVGDQVIAYGRQAEIVEVKNGADNAARLIYKDTGEKGWCPLPLIQLKQTIQIIEALAPNEAQMLVDCEVVIGRGLKTFVEVGEALTTIRDLRLYRAEHATYEDYLEKRWDISRSRAYQLMGASVVTQTLSTNVDTPPANEAQARPMTTVPADQQVEVWKEVEKTAPAGGVTAAHVTQVVQSHRFYRPGDKLIYKGRTYEVIGVRGNQRLNIRDIETKAMIFDIDPADVQDPHALTPSEPEIPTVSSVPTAGPNTTDLPSEDKSGAEIPPSNSLVPTPDPTHADPRLKTHPIFYGEHLNDDPYCPHCGGDAHSHWRPTKPGYVRCNICENELREDSLEWKLYGRMADRRNGNGKPMKPKLNTPATPDIPQGYDACQTPPYALIPLLPYLKPEWVIWEPARGEGWLAQVISGGGLRTVYTSDLLTGQNFFSYQPDSDWHVLVTNPPYSIKYDWLERCYRLAHPFALLMPVEVLGAKTAQDLFRVWGIEVMFMNQRVDFKMPEKGWNSSAQFPTAWFTWGLEIGQAMTFADITLAKSMFVKSLSQPQEEIVNG